MLISVVIPLYNKAHTIVNTLNTVMCQTYRDFEVIIVNDGSTDDGVEVIGKNFNDSRIRIVNQENAGVSVARNTGIKAAKGEWIAFLDADDEWMPVYLQTVMNTVDAYPNIDLIFSGRYEQNATTRVRRSVVPAKYSDRVTGINFFYNPHVFAHISATVVRTKLLQDNLDTFGLFIEGQKSNEDFTFLYRVALHCRCLYIGMPLTIYNGNVEGQATSVLKEQKKLTDNILMRNMVIAEWNATGRKNKVCGIFMKYETRHGFLYRLKAYDYTGLQILIDGMSKECKDFYLNYIEKILLTKPALNKIAVIYMCITKVLWRLHGYPVIGK